MELTGIGIEDRGFGYKMRFLGCIIVNGTGCKSNKVERACKSSPLPPAKYGHRKSYSAGGGREALHADSKQRHSHL